MDSTIFVCSLRRVEVLFPFLPFLPILFYGGPLHSTCLAWSDCLFPSQHSIADVNMTHMLYAYDLSLTANEPGQLQMMLDRLSAYALRKELIVNASK